MLKMICLAAKMLPAPACQNCWLCCWLHLPAPLPKLLRDRCRKKTGQEKQAPSLLLKALRCPRLAQGARPQRPCRLLKGKAPASCVPCRTLGMSAILCRTFLLAARSCTPEGGESSSSTSPRRSACSSLCNARRCVGRRRLGLRLVPCCPFLLLLWRPSCLFP